MVIEDRVQPGFAVPATFAGLNLNVRRGDGTLLADFAEVQGFARVATTAALAGTGIAFGTAGGGQFTDVDRALDGSTLNLNDLVLVKNQGTASQNGVYRVTVVDLATNRITLARDAAFDTAGELANSFVAVTGGTSANRYFQAGAVVTLNTSAVNYTLQGATQDYYAIYDPTTGAFRLLLSDNYTAGNVNPAGQVPDTRAGEHQPRPIDAAGVRRRQPAGHADHQRLEHRRRAVRSRSHRRRRAEPEHHQHRAGVVLRHQRGRPGRDQPGRRDRRRRPRPTPRPPRFACRSR